jgi:sugar lactone lactonase YvrE
MKQKLITIFAVLALLVATMNAQWVNQGAFPNDTYIGGTHGIAVDPDGKIWVASYFQDVPWVVTEGDTIWTAGILVFNPDGTEAPFSPITVVTSNGGFQVDTLHGNCRGLDKDQDGNIVYVQSSPSKAIKIDYTNGEGLASALVPEQGSSPTAAAVSDDGTIFIGPVVGGDGKAIAMYDTDLNYIGNAVEGPPAIGRTMEVSADGNTIYWMPFTALKVYVYQRPDEFSAYALVDSLLEGMSIESSAWNPATGQLWVSNDERSGLGTYEHLTWYSLDVTNAKTTILNQFSWEPTDDLTEFPRGLDFSPDGETAYVGTFTTGTARIQAVQNMGGNVNSTWTNEGAFPNDTYLGGTHGIAVDPDDKVWVASYFQDVPWVISEGDTIWTAGILVFNPDGTEAPFSPIVTVNTAKGIDTLHGNCRGLDKDQDGNIIYVQSSPSKAIKINYSNGEGMASALVPEQGSSPTAAAVSDDGTVYIGPVVGGDGKAIAMYDTDLNYLGNAVEGPPAIGRTMEVSADGNTIYWMPFTALKVYVYQRPDEFSAYALVDSLLEGMSIESSAWNPATGNLWVSNDERSGLGIFDHLTWYEVDVSGAKAALLNSFTWDPTDDLTEFPRGLDFSTDGETAYFGTFTTGTARIQKAVNTVSDIREIDDALPTGYSLRQNYPNPFNPNTVIEFTIPQTEMVTLKVYDLLGQEVTTLHNEVTNAGSYIVDFSGAGLASGMYVYRIVAGKFVESKKMMLMK